MVPLTQWISLIPRPKEEKVPGFSHLYMHLIMVQFHMYDIHIYHRNSIVDVTVPFEGEEDSLTKARELKEDKYSTIRFTSVGLTRTPIIHKL